MTGNPLLAEQQLAVASRCYSLHSSIQKLNIPGCPTITYEEALRRELEYRRRLESTHPHLLVGLNESPVLPKVVGTDSTPDVLKRKSTPEIGLHSAPASSCLNTGRSQPANWYPSKKKVKVQQLPSQAVQSPRLNLIPSFWCKICKVDCVTEFNFSAHIGGKKHKAKKLEILGNRNTQRAGSQSVGNKNPGPNNDAASGSRNGEQKVDQFSSLPEMQSSVSYSKVTGEASDASADKNTRSL